MFWQIYNLAMFQLAKHLIARVFPGGQRAMFTFAIVVSNDTFLQTLFINYSWKSLAFWLFLFFEMICLFARDTGYLDIMQDKFWECLVFEGAPPMTYNTQNIMKLTLLTRYHETVENKKKSETVEEGDGSSSRRSTDSNRLTLQNNTSSSRRSTGSKP
eukprot:UN00642